MDLQPCDQYCADHGGCIKCETDPKCDRSMKYLVNRLSNITNSIIKIEKDLLIQRLKLNDCIYKIRKLKDDY